MKYNSSSASLHESPELSSGGTRRRLSVRLLSLIAVISGSCLLLISCQSASTDYKSFTEAVIQLNLATMDSAGKTYEAQLRSSGPSSAATTAATFLSTQPGVKTAIILPDSTVYVSFANGFHAVTGDLGFGRGDSALTRLPSPPILHSQRGGYPGFGSLFVIPFPDDLPGTALEAGPIRKDLGTGDTLYGADVTADAVQYALASGGNVIFWAGHGVLTSPDSGRTNCAALLLPQHYSTADLASEVVNSLADGVKPATGAPLYEVVKNDFDGRWYVAITPAFVRSYAHLASDTAYRTMVYLSSCFGAYVDPSAPGSSLKDAFLAAGADLVCGYDWEVIENFAVSADTTFFAAMADTCIAFEACRSLPVRTDQSTLWPPSRGFKPVGMRVQPYCRRYENWTYYGDSMIMLTPVLHADVNGMHYRTSSIAISHEHPGLSLNGSVPGGFGDLIIKYPDDVPGACDVTTTHGAWMDWSDPVSGRVYGADSGYIGVSGTIKIDNFQYDYVSGSFSGNLGWWNDMHDPLQDPPDDVVHVTNGIIKFTGNPWNSR